MDRRQFGEKKENMCCIFGRDDGLTVYDSRSKVQCQCCSVSNIFFANTIHGYGEVFRNRYVDFEVVSRKLMFEIRAFGKEIMDTQDSDIYEFPQESSSESGCEVLQNHFALLPRSMFQILI